MVVFDDNKPFKANSGFNYIQFGSGAPLLESELNELQGIMKQQTKLLVNSLNIDRGFTKLEHKVTNGTLEISGIAFLIDTLFQVTSLTIPLGTSASIYLKCSVDYVTKDSTLYQYGNLQQSKVIPNNIQDVRIGEETSRRQVITYSLQKGDNTGGYTIFVGDYVGGVFYPADVLDLGEGKAFKAHVGNETENIHVKNVKVEDLQELVNKGEKSLMIVTTETGNQVPPSSDSLDYLLDVLKGEGLSQQIVDRLIPILEAEPTLIERILSHHEGLKATHLELGHVKVDGKTIKVDKDGTIGLTDQVLKLIAEGNGTGDGDLDLDLEVDPVIYGVRINTKSSNPEVEYIYDAEGFTAGSFNSDREFSYNGWENRFPFNQIKPMVVSYGEHVEDLDPNNFLLNTEGEPSHLNYDDSWDSLDVVIEFPLTYYKIERLGDFIEICISDTKIDDTWCCNAHLDADHNARSKMYLGAYLSSDEYLNELKSIPNVGFTPNSGLRTLNSAVTIDDIKNQSGTDYDYDFYDYFYNIGTENGAYHFMNFHQLTLVQILFLLLFKTRDSSVLGVGANNYNSITELGIGVSAEKGMVYGEPNNPYSQITQTPSVFLGLEHLFGGYYNFISGVMIEPAEGTSSRVYIYLGFGESSSIYDEIFIEEPEQGIDYITDVWGSNTSGFLPKATEGGTSSTYYCDEFVGDVYSYLYEGMLVGGDGLMGSDVGIFKFTPSINDYVSEIGARLAYLGGDVVE